MYCDVWVRNPYVIPSLIWITQTYFYQVRNRLAIKGALPPAKKQDQNKEKECLLYRKLRHFQKTLFVPVSRRNKLEAVGLHVLHCTSTRKEDI